MKKSPGIHYSQIKDPFLKSSAQVCLTQLGNLAQHSPSSPNSKLVLHLVHSFSEHSRQFVNTFPQVSHFSRSSSQAYPSMHSEHQYLEPSEVRLYIEGGSWQNSNCLKQGDKGPLVSTAPFALKVMSGSCPSGWSIYPGAHWPHVVLSRQFWQVPKLRPPLSNNDDRHY